jgi:hypothetical protein
MARHTEGMHARDTDSQVPMYHTEHMLAYIMAVAAIVLGVIGALRGFGILGEGALEQAAEGNFAALDAGGGNPFWDALVWLLPAISAAFLAFALHSSEHHLARNPATLDDAHKSMFNAEHFGAWAMGLVAIACGALAILVGFDVFDRGNTQGDGIIWGLLALGSSGLTATLHGVRHHQLATDEDYILSVVERRASQRSTTTAPGTTSTARPTDPNP